ncbi:hypothetical protein M0812_04060 [Anaeramoeba flamelloides]|uniref:Uncharacterized protein n=1 Tax=Anaeramoeba flamelloides TaxID=1746091 RepID=A0AAV8AHA8_9EUKA|nr:hypothetical protein M0812_04060 [Anaeramoeba flamelloides]
MIEIWDFSQNIEKIKKMILKNSVLISKNNSCWCFGQENNNLLTRGKKKPTTEENKTKFPITIASLNIRGLSEKRKLKKDFKKIDKNQNIIAIQSVSILRHKLSTKFKAH